jgi:hypothetical protein
MNKSLIKGELVYQLRYLEVARVWDGTLHMRNLGRRHNRLDTVGYSTRKYKFYRKEIAFYNAMKLQQRDADKVPLSPSSKS